MTKGITTNGPMPTMKVMFSDVASIRPRPRSSCSDSFIEKQAPFQPRADGPRAENAHQRNAEHSKKRAGIARKLRSFAIPYALHSEGRTRADAAARNRHRYRHHGSYRQRSDRRILPFASAPRFSFLRMARVRGAGLRGSADVPPHRADRNLFHAHCLERVHSDRRWRGAGPQRALAAE